MIYYEYNNFNHFSNTVSKIFKNEHDIVLESERLNKKIKHIYKIYFDEKEKIKKYYFKYPTTVFCRYIYRLENKDEGIIEDVEKFIEDIIEDFNKITFFCNRLKKIESMRGKPGIYMLYNKNKELVYIGKSKDLKSRLNSSIKEKEEEIFYFRFSLTDNPIDASIYEPYLIGIHQPKLNCQFIGEGNPTIKLPELKISDLFKVRKNQWDAIMDLKLKKHINLYYSYNKEIEPDVSLSDFM